MVILLAGILAIGQTASERRADLVLQAAVEEFVRRQPGARPPEPYRSLIRQLGTDCYGCRERASKRLAAACSTPYGFRWLFWGRLDHDAEIRLRCNVILRQLARCDDCSATGLCRFYRPDTSGTGPCSVCGRWIWSHPEQANPCLSCGGYGSAWNKGAPE
jgi:hypothetical protein